MKAKGSALQELQAELSPAHELALKEDAAFTMELISTFLAKLEERLPRFRMPKKVPAAFLFELGSALRICMWEATGLVELLDAGFPPGKQAVINAFHWFDRNKPMPGKPPALMTPRVMVFIQSLLVRHEGLELAVKIDDEEAFLEKLADFAWQHRHNSNSKPTRRRTR